MVTKKEMLKILEATDFPKNKGRTNVLKKAEYRQSLKGRRLNKKKAPGKKKHDILYNLTHSQFVRDKTRMANNHPSTRGKQMKTAK